MCGVGAMACCFGSAACSAFFSLCNACANSTLAKINYALILLLTLVVSCIMLSPGLEGLLSKVPFCEESRTGVLGQMADYLPGSEVTKIKCQDAIGYLAVYRVCFIVTLFFLIFAALMVRVRSSQDPRAGLQNGFWGVKYLLLVAGLIGAFFIPHGSFGTTWMYFGLIGGLAFIVVQLVLIIDFAHSWAETWQANLQETDNRNWFYALLAVTFAFFGATLGVIIFCYSYYTGVHVGDCKLHEFFISFNMILCVGLSVVSVLPIVQEHQPNSGLLQSSFVSLYVMYLTWSAMTNHPDPLCKPKISDLIGITNSTSTTPAPSGDEPRPTMDTASIVGLIIWFACVLYSSIRTSSSDNAARLSMERTTLTDPEAAADVESGNTDEDEGVTYNWSLFHLMFALATLYMMMTLTNWYSPGADVNLESINANMSAVWVKIISAWACVVLYVWTMAAPVLLPDRDFSV